MIVRPIVGIAQAGGQNWPQTRAPDFWDVLRQETGRGPEIGAKDGRFAQGVVGSAGSILYLVGYIESA